MIFNLYTVYRLLFTVNFPVFHLLIAVCLSFMLGAPVYAAAAEDIQILKISPADERAVIKTPDAKMQIIAGDMIEIYQHSAVSY